MQHSHSSSSLSKSSCIRDDLIACAKRCCVVSWTRGPTLDDILNHAGARIGLYSTFTALTRVAICFGPLGAALMFWWSGNVWETHVIEQIMLVGVGLSAVSILPMFLFNDDLTLGADSDAYQELLTIEGGSFICRAAHDP